MAKNNVIGERVRKLRESRDMTQAALAAKCNVCGWDVSRVTLAKVEAGIRVVNDAEVVVLASALGSTPGELLDKVKVSQAAQAVRQGQSEAS